MHHRILWAIVTIGRVEPLLSCAVICQAYPKQSSSQCVLQLQTYMHA